MFLKENRNDVEKAKSSSNRKHGSHDGNYNSLWEEIMSSPRSAAPTQSPTGHSQVQAICGLKSLSQAGQDIIDIR